MTGAGCTVSPKEQGDRERKAASVQVFKLHMTKDLWTRTNSGGSPKKNLDKPKSLTEDPSGMVTIELTGPQMVDYLQILDYNAHGGASARDEPLAATVYDAVTPVVDQIRTPPVPGAPAPEVTIHAAVAPTTSAPPK
ncbi:hypothetical protein ACFQZZ_07210 [Nocardia sp. GCM10030253]|uniref:hypothetical protein n=1 Tax=Nocardia sp. GCM10030253 TaxID=3273404 RepID=UPI00363CCBA6